MMDSLNKQHFELSESVRDDTQYNTNKQVIGENKDNAEYAYYSIS